MNSAQQHSGSIKTLVFTLLTASLSLTAFPVVTPAQTFVPPNRGGMPGRNEGGGTRGTCVSNTPNLTALIPQTNHGLTSQAHPTLLWYVPHSTATIAEFELHSEAGEILYTRQIPLTKEAGIIQIHLPATEQTTLEPGKLYRWFFAIVCDRADPSSDVLTEGWIERVTPDTALTSQLEQTTGEARALLYAKAGYWYDALSTLAKVQVAQAQQPMLRSWVNLLTDGGLRSIANKPLLLVDTTAPPATESQNPPTN